MRFRDALPYLGCPKTFFQSFSLGKDLLRYVDSRFSLPSSPIFSSLGCGIVSAKGSPGSGISTCDNHYFTTSLLRACLLAKIHLTVKSKIITGVLFLHFLDSRSKASFILVRNLKFTLPHRLSDKLHNYFVMAHNSSFMVRAQPNDEQKKAEVR